MHKALIITYYWPPSGGPGVQRWLQFAKHLPNYGVKPIVFAPTNAHYPIIDKSLEEEVANIEVVRYPIWEPYHLANKFYKGNEQHSAGFYQKDENQTLKAKLSLFVRGNLFIPDARKFWVNPAVRFLKNYIKEHNISTIITTGPPHSVHLIGMKLKSQLTIRWIADFRDPWVNVYYYQSLRLMSWADRKHRRLEREVLQAADEIITVTHEYKDNYQELTPKPVHCLTNGFDAEQMPTKVVLNKKFNIAYIGTMFKERSPESLWQAISELLIENKIQKEDLSIDLIGRIDGEVMAILRSKGLGEVLNHQGYLPHKEALKRQFSAKLLLLITANQEDKKGNIPGKLFEYLATQRPILALGPRNSEVQRIISETHAGYYVFFEDKEAIKACLISVYGQYKSKNLTLSSLNIAQYSRQSITQALAKIILN